VNKRADMESGIQIFMVAGEPSGDQLGGKLIGAIKRSVSVPVSFNGVGGEAMESEGCNSLFPLSDVSIMGPVAILAQLPKLVRRVYQTVDAIIAANPDVLVIIDSPEFTHPIAKRVRERNPEIPIIDYVSPSVWAWRSGRAGRMRHYVNHILALLPFEPGVHKKLGGPPCTYVGHPLIERLDWIKNLKPDELTNKLGLKRGRKILTVLPGSRRTEVTRLMEPFGATLKKIIEDTGDVEVIVPIVPSVRHLVEEGVKSWPVKPHLVEGERAKFQAFRASDAALAASGTVTLELALSATPMVVAYRVELIIWLAHKFVLFTRDPSNIPSIVLPNLVLGKNAFPEFIEDRCTPENLSAALLPLLKGGQERDKQIAALKGIVKIMRPANSQPSDMAAKIVLEHAKRT
jgi:lipid-A-disaccharide synthase